MSARPGRQPSTRTQVVGLLRQKLEADSCPRMQMGLIVALTGGMGLLCSFVLLRLGMHAMALRYPLALLGAYLFFLFLLWLWIRTNAQDYGDIPDVSGLLPNGSAAEPGSPCASVEVEADAMPDVGRAGGALLEADELVIPLAVIGLAVCVALASLYVVYLAPGLLAELLFDGVLSYTLYRHLRATQCEHWLSTAVRRTAWPFAITALVLVGAGMVMTAYAPGARSVGEVIHGAAPVR